MGRRVSFSYDELCELGAMASRAPASVITLLNVPQKHIEVLGRFSTVNPYTFKYAIPGLHAVDRPFVAYRDVQTNPAFKDHPILLLEPRVKTLIAVVLKHQSTDVRITMTLLNPELAIFDEPSGFTCLSKLVQHFRRLLADQSMPTVAASEDVVLNSRRKSSAQPDSSDPSARFLMDTLRKSQGLHSRNAGSYVTVRRWRNELKPYQISALQALKATPPGKFLDSITDEMADTANHLFGNQTFAAVVPVPGGSSGTDWSLSELMAERLAKKLGCPFRPMLRRQPVMLGKSHPRKSALLKPYEIEGQINGNVLLVDDVATSGRHLELAQASLRQAGAVCMAMAWIGN